MHASENVIRGMFCTAVLIEINIFPQNNENTCSKRICMERKDV